jgi:hypothetical protein
LKDWSEALNDELDRIQKDFPQLAPSRAFILWFVSAYHNLKEQDVFRTSLTCKPDDKTIDAIYVDDKQKTVFIYQSKFTTNYGQSAFAYDDLKVFASVKDYFLSGSQECPVLKYANPNIRRLLPHAYESFKERGWPLELVFFTNHKDNPQAVQEMKDLLGDFSNTRLTVFAYERIKGLFRDWEEDAIPRIGDVILRFRHPEILTREAGADKIKSVVVSVPVGNIAALHKSWGNDLFARNVREFLGRTKKANREIRKTLKDKPHQFWYYNNGITMTSEKIDIKDDNSAVMLKNPQIINGGQTVRIIGDFAEADADVLTRIVQVPEDDWGRAFVQEMIAANNTQSHVDWVDLRANHPLQVSLQRALMREGYFFERKKNEFNRKHAEGGYQFEFYYPNGQIKNVDLAQAIIAIERNPEEAKEGTDKIFEVRFDFVFRPRPDVYDFILAHQFNEILRLSCRATNVQKVDGRFSEERPMVYKHARLHALHLIFRFGHILALTPDEKRKLSAGLRDEESMVMETIAQLVPTVLSFCYERWQESNMDAIDFFSEKGTLQILTEGVPARISRQISKLARLS